MWVEIEPRRIYSMVEATLMIPRHSERCGLFWLIAGATAAHGGRAEHIQVNAQTGCIQVSVRCRLERFLITSGLQSVQTRNRRGLKVAVTMGDFDFDST